MAQKPIEFPASLTEKYRPRRVQDFIGIFEARCVLEEFLKAPRSKAFFFLGSSGLGKTTLAMAFAEQIHAETHYIPSQNCDLDTVESITKMCWCGAFDFKTGKACEFHVVICDEADRMTPAAQTSLLSKLDSTAAPPLTIWIFTANTKANLEPRFLSRCSVLEFDAESMEDELPQHLERIFKQEGGRHKLNFTDIAKSANWNVRDAINKLEIELLIDRRRKELPTKELQIIEAHFHNCKKCHKRWKHQDETCELPYRSVCPECGGSSSIGQERAKKAWVTIRKNIENDIKTKKRKKA